MVYPCVSSLYGGQRPLQCYQQTEVSQFMQGWPCGFAHRPRHCTAAPAAASSALPAG